MPKTQFGDFVKQLVTDPETQAMTIYPLMAIGEAIATRGERPGTTALQQQKIIMEGSERRRQREQEELERAEVERTRAIRRRLEQEIGAIPSSSDDWQQQALYKEREIDPYAAYERGHTVTRPEQRWQAMQTNWDKLVAMPEGAERDAELMSYLGRFVPYIWASQDPTIQAREFQRYKDKLRAATQEGLLRKELELPYELDKAQKMAGIQAAEERGKRVGKMSDDFAKVESLMTKLWQRKNEQLQQEPIKGGGPIVGGMKQALAAAETPGFSKTAAFEGQRAETAFALNGIITGQNRVVQGLYNRILSTLPTVRNGEQYSWDKIEQSVRNTFGLLKAIERAGLLDDVQNATEEDAENLNSSLNKQMSAISPDELDEQEELGVQAVLQRIRDAGQRKQPRAVSPQPAIPSTPQTKTINGVTYQLGADGKWHKIR